jgi:hypothetical protein
MNLLHSLTTGGATKELSNFVTCWLVPLFILFNVIGWLGLTQREADRSDSQPSDKDRSDLGRAIWRAWLVGILAALAGLWFIFAFFEPSLKSYSPPWWMIGICAFFGLLLGIARGVLPRTLWFRNLLAIIRRRILSALIISAVACSIVCGVVYYDRSMTLQNIIVSFYACMLIGYTATYVFEVGK